MANITYQSNIPEVKKIIWAAENKGLREIGKFVQKEAKNNVTSQGIIAERTFTITRRGKKIKVKRGQVKSSIGYWVFRKEQRVLIGIRPKGWFGGFFELGTSEIPKQPFLSPAVEKNISKIRQIEDDTIRGELMK